MAKSPVDKPLYRLVIVRLSGWTRVREKNPRSIKNGNLTVTSSRSRMQVILYTPYCSVEED